MSKPNITDSLEYPSNLNTSKSFFALGIVGLLASVVGYFIDTQQFFFSYLNSFVFFSSIALASLFFVMLQHVTRSTWSVLVRRIPETISSNIFVWFLFLIPVLFGLHDLYHWSHESAVAHDPVLQGKEPWLNPAFFIIRQIIYFSVWGFLGYRLYKNSIKMDETGDWGLQTLLRRTSGPGIFLFAITVPFAAFDWIMSLDPHWYSTIFGVYFFAMSFQALFPVLILVLFYLNSKGMLKNSINDSHVYDLGVLMFGFTVFYAYIAFCQYLLIYYGNLPEETVWFYHRLEGGWQYIAMAFLFGRFVIPFLVLLPKKTKSNRKVVMSISILILIIHFFELFWIVMPNFSEEAITFSWMDITALVGLGGIFFGLFFNKFSKHSIVPKNDPKLADCLNKHL